MFGYIRPNKMELKLKDIRRYGDLYCGLCHELRSDYGQLYGCALSYDLTFLLALLNGFADDKCQRTFRCPLNPMKKKSLSVSENALDYAAFINYFLMYLKISDDVLDDKSISKKILQSILSNNKKYQKKYEKYMDNAEILKSKIAEFNIAEKNESNFDELTNLFGEFFSIIFLSYFDDSTSLDFSDDLHKLCFNLGKWIYLIDAYDDYPKDIKKSNFNLLNTMYFGDSTPTMEQIHQRVQGITAILINNMKNSLKKINLKQDYDIVDNIISYGCNYQYIQVIKKKYPDLYNKSNCKKCDCCK